MIQIYNPDNTNFEKNGDMTIFPSSAITHAILNGSWEAEMEHPIDNKGRWKYIQEDAVVKLPSFNGNQLFRIKSIEKSDSGITCRMEPIFFDSIGDCFLEDIRPTAKNGQEALDLMTEPNKKYSGKSDITRTATSYYQFKNLMQAINGEDDNSFINRWGGEILFDNFEIVINDRVGGDYGVELRYGKNIPQDGLTEEVDTCDIVTRIYPKAYNGYMMTDNGYVDSDLIGNYPTVKIKTITFEDVKMLEDAQEDDGENVVICSTQEELDEALRKKCEEEFASGIDKPKVTISADMILLQNTDLYADYNVLEEVSLGDTIHCRHNRLGIVTDARVIELQYDCIRKKPSSVVIGDFKYDYFKEVSSSVNRIDKAIRPNGTLIAEKISGFIDGAMTSLRAQYNTAKKQDVLAILFENLDEESEMYGALAIGTQGILISKKRSEDGKTWDWTTAMTASGLMAGIVVAGILSDKTGKNYWDLDTGEFSLSSTASKIDGKQTGDVLKDILGESKEYSDSKLSDFVSSVYNSDIASLQSQIDGQIETFYYDYEPELNNIPASQWTTEEDRQKHEGDLFYWKSKGYAYRFFKDGDTWKWQLVRDTDVTKALADAAEAQDTADSKRRVFITTPVPPYDEGDLWVQGSGGDIMRCQTARKSGNYVSSDWVKASKYTDDSALNAFINGDFKSQIEELEKQNDKKAETWRQSADPSTSWTTSELKSEHTGDLWYNTSTQKYYRWSGTSWEEMKAQPPDAVFDSIDGKAQIFVSQPKPPYDKGDLWITSTTNGEAGIKICTTARESGSYVSSDWIDTKYVDSSSVDSKIKAYDTSLGQTEVFNKLTNGGADQGIYIKDGKLYINASYILAGMLAGKYINAKGITVKDKDNNVTLSIDDNGNVTLRVSSFSLQGKSIQAIADSSAGTVLESAKEYTLEQIEGIQGITGNLIKGYNLTSDDIASYWDTAGTLTYGYDDPAGGKMAVRLYGSTSDNFISANRSKNQVLYATGRYTFSVWLKSDAARTIKISLNRVTYTCSVTTSWKRFSFTANVSSIQSSYQLFTIGGWSSIGSGAYVYAYHPEVTFEFSAEEYFNILTNNGATQGIYFKDGKIYINAAYIDTGNLAGWVIDKANELIRSKNGTIILDAKNNKITTTTGGNGYKTEITAGEVDTGKTTTGELQAGLGKLGTNSSSYIEIGDEFNGESSELCINGKMLVNKDYMKLYSIKQVSSSSLIAFASDGATISWVSSSSKRYKDIGQELTEEDIEDMYDIPVVWAKYKDGYLDESDERCGKYMPMFIAEDVDSVFPIAADHKDGKTENWNFRVMIPLMFQMLKSQKKEIEELKKMLK